MRAKRLIKASFESDRGTARRRRLTPCFEWRVRCHVLAILAGALALSAFWGPAPGWDDTETPPAETVASSAASQGGSLREALKGEHIAPESAELDTVSFHGSTVDAAVLTATVPFFLGVVHWLHQVGRVQLRPGITSSLLVPG